MEWRQTIPELREKFADYKQKRSKAKTSYSKYKTALFKFYFLDVIRKVRKGESDDKNLEVAIKDLFASLGFDSYNPISKADFDVIAMFKKITLGIEVKNGNMVPENDMFQALKYHGRKDDVTHAILLWNNHTTNQNFDKNRIHDAVRHGYGIMTTKSLYNGYLLLKQDKISFDYFLNQLLTTGEIKYSTKHIGKPKNSDATR